MMQDIFEVGPGQYCLVRPLIPPQLIKEGFLGVLLLVYLFFFLLPPSGYFSADALDYYVSNTSKPNLLLYLSYYAEACNEFGVPISAS